MIRFMRLHGVDLGDTAGLPQVPRTPEGQAMGAIPGWKFLADPAYVDVAATEIRNRALPNDVSSSVGTLLSDSFPNDAPALKFESPWTQGFVQEKAGFNPTAWSAFAVVQPEPGELSMFFRSVVNTTEPNIGVRFGFHSNGNIFNVYEYGGTGSGQPTRLAYNGGFYDRGGPCLIMVTFSTRDGLRIFDNGTEAAAAPDDKRPLEAGYGPGEIQSHFNLRGLYGMMGLLDIDLGWPEHAGYRRAIERFLMNKYGIS